MRSDTEISKIYTRYVQVAIQNHAVRLYKKANRLAENEVDSDDQIIEQLLIQEDTTLLDYLSFKESVKLEEFVVNDWLSTALSTLTPRQKQILFLSTIQQYSDTEIGRFLHVSVQTINKQRTKAMQKLTRVLLKEVGWA